LDQEKSGNPAPDCFFAFGFLIVSATHKNAVSIAESDATTLGHVTPCKLTVGQLTIYQQSHFFMTLPFEF
jgi:hypothetical protein